jgi:hypothetical protein
MLLRALPVSLAPLGRIDAGEPDPVLLMRRIEKGERVAVCDGDDGAEELGSVCCRREQRQQ